VLRIRKGKIEDRDFVSRKPKKDMSDSFSVFLAEMTPFFFSARIVEFQRKDEKTLQNHVSLLDE
jgi:hypothetical protein